MTPEEAAKCVEHFRKMSIPTYMDCMADALIRERLETCLTIVNPPDADDIREHVKSCINKAPHYALGD